jgi:pyruvate/2-oxoglutarate/acetoin dehydrogenase E1 component
MLHSELTYAQAINLALTELLKTEERALVFGLGVNDPKRIFGTTLGLLETFGDSRVFDFPVSENAMTGFAVGLATNGYKPIVIHQRLDFFLLAMDQLVNSAAKWRFMFNGIYNQAITFRLIVGRGWGQGPTHSQNLQAWFAHIPGLKVFAPTFPEDIYLALKDSNEEGIPRIIIEDRWLYNQKVELSVIENISHLRFEEKPKLCLSGRHITIISSGVYTLEAIRAAKWLDKFGVSSELFDLRCISPLRLQEVFASIKKTRNALVLESGCLNFSISSEIMTRIVEECFSDLAKAPVRIGSPFLPMGSSPTLAEPMYQRADDIAAEILKILGREEVFNYLHELKEPGLRDTPGAWFKGPF